MENLKKIKEELDKNELINNGTTEEITAYFSDLENIDWAARKINSRSMYPLLIGDKLEKLEEAFSNVKLEGEHTDEELAYFNTRKELIKTTCKLEQDPSFDEDRQQAKAIFNERLGIDLKNDASSKNYDENIGLINQTLSFLIYLKECYKDNFEFQTYKVFRNNSIFLYLINYITVYYPKYVTEEMQNYFTEVVRDLQYHAARNNFANSKEYRKILKHTQKNLKTFAKEKIKEEKVKKLSK